MNRGTTTTEQWQNRLAKIQYLRKDVVGEINRKKNGEKREEEGGGGRERWIH